MSKKKNLGRSLILSKRRKRKKQLSERHTVNDIEPVGEFASVLDQNDIETFMDKIVIQKRTEIVQRYYEYEENLDVCPPKPAPDGSFELPIPQRPPWVRGKTTKKQLMGLEEEVFLEWRRKLSEMSDQYVLTPFERNPNVWRQLWRVVEHSDLVFQIVDARNPLLFRSSLLEIMAKKKNKEVYLILNKSDLLNESQREVWAEALENLGVTFFFFSAVEEMEDVLKVSSKANKKQCEQEISEILPQPRNKVLSYVYSRNELLGLLKTLGQDNFKKVKIEQKKREDENPSRKSNKLLKRKNRKYQKKAAPPSHIFQNSFKIGMIGYPNVGKSSVINVLSGLVRVSVAATPGKTKYMQTVPLCPGLVLYDCPGLVFPTIGSSQAEMVCNGILPIDRLRARVIEPVSFLCRRIPKEVLEMTYGIKIKCENPTVISIPRIPDEEEEGEDSDKDDDDEDIENITEDEVKLRFVSSREFMVSFCEQKSMMTQKHNPNIPQASRVVLKDYVNGKLLYVHPPPDALLSGDDDDDEEGEGENGEKKRPRMSKMRDEVEMEMEEGEADLEKFFEKKRVKREGEEELDQPNVIINLDHGMGKVRRKWRRKGPSQDEMRAGLMFNEGNVGIVRLMQRLDEKEERRRIRNRRRKNVEDNQQYVIMDGTGEKVSVKDYNRREKNRLYKEKMAKIKGLSKQQVRMMKRNNIL